MEEMLQFHLMVRMAVFSLGKISPIFFKELIFYEKDQSHNLTRYDPLPSPFLPFLL